MPSLQQIMSRFENPIELALAPLYVAQGAFVRWRTPRLPEPDGARSGCAGQGASLRVLIAGDSSAAGVGVRTQDEALSGQLVQRLSQSRRVAWRLVARTGLTTSSIVDLLQATPAEVFDVALVATGVNDLTGGMPASRWPLALDRLVDVLTTRFAARHIFFSPLPPMHEFPALPAPLRSYVGRRARAYNVTLATFVAERAQCELLGAPFAPDDVRLSAAELMASDGFHPGAPIYATWATSAAAAIGRTCEPNTNAATG